MKSALVFNPRHQMRDAVGASDTKARVMAPNHREDVHFVQCLLNRGMHLVPNFKPLDEDGRCGPKTLAAITLFQVQFVRKIKADGRVDPGGMTLRALTTGQSSTSAAKSVSRGTASSKPDRPFPPHVLAFIQAHADAGRKAATTWKVPASVLLAQAALESGWGRHVKANAYFGIKGKAPSGKSTSFKTHEVVNGKSIAITDSFRAYQDFAEAADDYGRFLNQNPRYKECFKHSSDPAKFVDALAAAGYATDPSYASKLKATISKYGLADYDR